ncbi:hypothetical protein AMK59_1941 [Oryctes borbonicus]|uniref:CC domain-containing protein n=1 Tax=Oryctes borbonicus TaxID=1629725 RepID=A0A0T6BFA1_9SCAR|nr:hypothetical protein AMK59_1941 [Oryctes borbonicus]
MKICILFVVLVVALGIAKGQEVEPEEQCASAGGVCAKGCEHSPYNKGLCPNQQKDGVECCYPLVEGQCRSQGGSCGSCPPPLGRSGLGCPNGTRCCIYL